MQENKILILNQGKTKNYGDIAINETIDTFFRNKGFKVDNYIFWLEEFAFGKNYSRLPEIIKKILWKLHFVRDYFLRRAIKKNIKLKEYNAVIIGGGELLSSHLGFNTALYTWTKILSNYNIPIYIIGVSGNNQLTNKLSDRTKKALEKCAKILVRDSYTYKLLNETYNIKCQKKPDVVFSYKQICVNTKEKMKNENKKAIMCVPIMYETLKENMGFHSKQEYFVYLENLIKENLNSGDEIIVTTTVYDDNNLARDFYLWLKENKNYAEIIFKEYTNIDDYIDLLNLAHTVISARMHALILALLYDCNIVVIPFKEKLKVFEKEYCSKIDIKEVEKESLESLEIINKEIIEQDKKWRLKTYERQRKETS